MILTAERVRARLDYKPATGVLRWRVNSKVAGCVSDDGYRLVGLDGRLYKAHRLAWLHYHGDWPAGELDHVNGDRDDNRIANLRECSRTQNNRNRHRGKHGRLLGAHLYARTGRWTSRITDRDGKSRHLGYFDTEQAAHLAYMQARRARDE